MSGNGPDRWQAIAPYLDQALELADHEQLLFVASLRGHDPELATELETLIAEHRLVSLERFLERPPASPLDQPLPGQRVGPYTLLSAIGHGGMGTVWLARRSDGRFERQVAIKFLRVALPGRGEERFKREGRILARLTHRHIAQLVDAGVSSAGQPYLVLEHIPGEHIERYCGERGMEIEARVRLFLDVLDAVAHAHANLIVHRDIKPSNVLVSRDGDVKLLDFGIAKLLEDDAATDATALTREGASVLTPQYAAPEQMTGGPITTATDVYALGVLLYVVLTGRHPAGDAISAPADLMKTIVEIDPPRPSDAAAEPRLRRALRGDLDTIVLRALKKHPRERYPSVTAFADDLRRHLAHLPITTRPDTMTYRAAKFIRRNRAAAALASIAIIVSVAGIIGTTIQARTARAQRDFALRQLARAEAINDLNDFLLRDAAPLGRPFTVTDLLTRAEAIVARQSDKRDPGRLEILIAMGRQYWVLDEDARSRGVLTEAYDLSRSVADPSIRAKAACALASSAVRSGDLSRASVLFQEGLRELGSGPQFALDRAFCLLRGAEVAREAASPQDAIARVQEAQRVLQAAPIRSEVVELRALTDLAESYRIAGRLREAAATFEEAFPRLTALGRDTTQTAGTWFNNWGLALGQLGRPAEAERILRRGIDVSRAGDDEQAVSPMLLTNYARVLRDLGRLSEAADYAERAYARARQADTRVVVNQSALLRAWIYIEQKDFPRAEAMLAEVGPALRKRFPPGHIALVALDSYASLLAHGRGDLPRAMQQASEALSSLEAAIKNGGEGIDFLPVLLLRRSAIALHFGRAEEAVADASRAIDILNKSNPPEMLVSTTGRAYLAFGRALHAQGKRDAARAAMQAAARHLASAIGPDHPHTLEAQRY